MGNSGAGLRSSKSEYGSSRNVTFTLPTKRQRSYSQSLPRRTPELVDQPQRPILRNNSNASSLIGSGHAYNQLRSQRPRSFDSHSIHGDGSDLRNAYSYQELESETGYQRIYDPANHSLSGQQYTDVYINNDLHKFYKAQDRSRTRANVDEDEMFDSTSSLDRKLFALKQQRGHNTRHSGSESPLHGVTARKVRSRKRQAPLPLSSTRAQGIYSKKHQAPLPPPAIRSQSLSALNSNSEQQLSLLEEIEGVLAKRHIPLSPTRKLAIESAIAIPQPDYEIELPGNSSESSTINQNQTSSILRKKKKAPPVPAQKPVIAPKPKSFTPAVSVQADFQTTTSNTTQHTIPKPTVKETREIAIQYDAPVEIAIQCNGGTLRMDQFGSKTSSVKSSKSLNPSILEVLELFNQATKGYDTTLPKNTQTTRCDNQSLVASTISDVTDFPAEGTSSKVELSDVLAGVPSPPPLPTGNVRLLTRKTIPEHVAVSMAPLGPENPIEINDEADDPPSMSEFSAQIREVYEKLHKKRQVNPTVPNKRRDSVEGLPAAAAGLHNFQKTDSIMGIKTLTENESDSGHDEMSDISNGDSGSREQKVPEYVFASLARSLSQTNISLRNIPKPDTFANTSGVSHKTNGIKKFRKTMSSFVSSISRSRSKKLTSQLAGENEFNDPGPILYSGENWTLSGRGRKSRPSLNLDLIDQNQTSISNRPQKISSIGHTTDEMEELTSPLSPVSSNSLRSLNLSSLKSFSLLTQSPVSPSKATPTHHRSNSHHQFDSVVSDVQL